MWIVRSNPVFVNEMRQSAFRKRGPQLVIGITLAALVYALLSQVPSFQVYAVYAPLILLPIVTPAIASGAFAKEYEQQTWMDLYLTPLTNVQVVFGKFFAYFLQTSLFVIALIPGLAFLAVQAYSGRLSELEASSVTAAEQLSAFGSAIMITIKLLISACLYIVLAMVCSRYSPNCRVALVWSYIAMGVYTLFNVLAWMLVGSIDYQVTQANRPGQMTAQTSNILLSGFMESFHLIFCGVLGAGAFVLLWVSLSEQRGYKRTDDGSGRHWQPVGRPARTRTA